MRLLVALVLAFMCAAFAALGFWQLERARWKSAFLADWQRALAAPPQPLAGALRDPSAALVRVEGVGRYDAEATVLLDNQRVGNAVGAIAYTLFRERETRRGVLVNRGFLPMDATRRVPDVVAPPAGDVAIAGLLRPPPSVGLALGNAAYERGKPAPLLAFLDVDALARAMDVTLDPRVLLLDRSAASHGAAVAASAAEWSALPNTMPPERHRGYALQWFALSAATVVVGTVLLLRRHRP